jgi:ATP adenylyltransferase
MTSPDAHRSPREPQRFADTERKLNLWAPWRMEYLKGAAGSDEGCFLCGHRDDGDRDEESFVFWRGARCFGVLNRYPYTGGHSLICPYEHVPTLGGLDTGTLLELTEMARDLQIVLTEAIGAEGFNVGMNVGRCAGAGLPGHLHVHVVPRWPGDTNFITVMGEVRVVNESLQKLHRHIVQTSERLSLPRLTP